MNDAETADLVRRIVGTWPMSPKGPLWTEAIRDLEYGPVLATFCRLRDEHDEQRLSIARFKQSCRAISNAGNTNRRHPSEERDDGPPMSAEAYFNRLAWRAGTGDPEASAVLDEWSTPFAQRMLAQLIGTKENRP